MNLLSYKFIFYLQEIDKKYKIQPLQMKGKFKESSFYCFDFVSVDTKTGG